MIRTASPALVAILVLACKGQEPTDEPWEGPLRLFFAEGHDADLGGVSGADTLCADDPGNPAPSSSWRALLGSPDRVPCADPDCAGGTAGQADWVLHPATDYGLSDGTLLFTTDANGITNEELPTDLDTSAYNFWSGLKEDWTVFPDTCSGWTSNGSGDGRVGWTQTRTDAGWLDGGTYPCDTVTPLLCVEQ
ncbi:MAG: DUF1554 domain-containing protein [Alphaproteobacteria bacterium]|nr:DUF1554 domain-containing protein [Alphaproteobacteria bacterium]